MLLLLVNPLRSMEKKFFFVKKKFLNFTCWLADDGRKLWANAVNIELTTSDGFCNVVDVFLDS